MSGLEVLGAASAVLGLLESAIGLVAQIREAHERQKELSAVLDRHTLELTKTKNTIQIIRDEEALQTAAVAGELVDMDKIANRLVVALKALRSDKGWKSQFLHQLVHGAKDESDLAKIMEELSREKTNLGLRISVAHVGLTRNLQNTMVVNTAIVERIEAVIQSVLGEGQGLKIAGLVRNRPVQDGDMVTLTDAEIASLSGQEASSRIVVDNVTEGQALQINGPIGKQEWYQVSHLAIKNNKATEQSIQINDGMSTEAFTLLLQSRSC